MHTNRLTTKHAFHVYPKQFAAKVAPEEENKQFTKKPILPGALFQN
jgi:hypothetical protein